MGYHRIELPAHEYQKYDSICGFKFNYAKNSIINSPNADQPCWLDISYPEFMATIHLSYKPINNSQDLQQFAEDAYKLTFKHSIKASAIDEFQINKPEKNVYGILYEVSGNAASGLQFVITDSTSNFLRGSMYFYATPNADSIAPVAEYIRKDVYKLIDSFNWK